MIVRVQEGKGEEREGRKSKGERSASPELSPSPSDASQLPLSFSPLSFPSRHSLCSENHSSLLSPRQFSSPPSESSPTLPRNVNSSHQSSTLQKFFPALSSTEELLSPHEFPPRLPAVFSHSSLSPPPSHPFPLWAPIVLSLAVLAVSSAAVVFRSISRAAPITRAGWRLQATSVVLLPGFCWELFPYVFFLIQERGRLPAKWKDARREEENAEHEGECSLGNFRVRENCDEGLISGEKEIVNEGEEEDVGDMESVQLRLQGARETFGVDPVFMRRYLCGRTFLLLLLSGVALSLHFGLWVLSIDLTSLPHSLLFVSTPPLIFALLSLAHGEKLSRGETGALLLASLGVLIIFATSANAPASSAISSLASTNSLAASSAISANSTAVALDYSPATSAHSFLADDFSVSGDVAAFLAAVAFVLYILIGSHLRQWMPLHLYVFPVNLSAALALSLAGAVFEGVEMSNRKYEFGAGEEGSVVGPLGWLSAEFFLPVLYLALGPGYLGHTGLNAVLLYFSPFFVSLAITLEPPLGSVLGYFCRLSNLPKYGTFLGGGMLLLAIVWVSVAKGDKERYDREGE